MFRDDRPNPPAMYAALGDSISIDEYAGGPGLGGASLFAHNRDDTFPHWRGRDLTTIHPGLRYQLFAVDGGTTEAVLDHQVPQLQRTGAAPAVVTLTIGGNDLLGTYGDTPRAQRIIAVVRRRVGQTLRQLRPLMRTPDDPIIVGTVYDPSDGTGDTDRGLWYCNVIEPNAWGADGVRAAFWQALHS